MSSDFGRYTSPIINLRKVAPKLPESGYCKRCDLNYGCSHVGERQHAYCPDCNCILTLNPAPLDVMTKKYGLSSREISTQSANVR